MSISVGNKIMSSLIGLGVAVAFMIAAIPAQAVSVSSDSAVGVQETRQCIAAKKKATVWEKKVAKIMKQRGTSIAKVAKAQNKYMKALNRAGKICSEIPVSSPKTFSGDPKDPRPVDWVRPADGSGLPGSNFNKVQVSANCPVTLSKVEMAEQVLESGHLVWVLTVVGENYSPQKVSINFSADVVNGKDGSNWDAVPSRGWSGETQITNKDRELLPWEEWQYSTNVLQNSNTSLGDLTGELLRATVTCL